MTNKILVVGFACLSLAAVAQSNGDKQAAPSPAPAATASPRDSASGQATGKRMHKPITVYKEVGVDETAREASTGKATGKTSAHDDWQTSSAKSTSQGRVAAGDVNGDGKADAAAAPKSGQNAAASSDVKSPRDSASGQASGKRTHAPAASTKDHVSDPAPQK